MYLKSFTIKHFRTISELSLQFKKGVNIIIGENNTGKSAIIDALRICLGYGKQWRDIYITKNDFFIPSDNTAPISNIIEFDMDFEIEEDSERYLFIELLSQDKENPLIQNIQLHFRYTVEVSSQNRPIKWKVWGGDNEGQIPSVDTLQLFYFTYLDPLRDAVEKLKPHTYGNKVASLFSQIVKFGSDHENPDIDLNDDKKKELSSVFKDELENEAKDWSKLIKYGESKVKSHLKSSSIEGKNSEIDFSFLPYEFEDIIKNIEVKATVGNTSGVNKKLLSLKHNGLGDNNLIYSATVLGDLINRKAVDPDYYYALLIEEPEAHLHPQKQNTFFNYLNKLNKEIKGIQVFITSHSPTITAKADLECIIVLQRQENRIASFSVTNSPLDPNNIKYLSKFLDVTKSQLFFSNGTILVEGISEALLLPSLAKKAGFDLDKYGVEIVNVDGVAFEHFAKLFNSTDNEKRLFARCSLLTDNDKGFIKYGNLKVDSLIDDNKAKEIFKELKEKGIVDRLDRIQKIDISETSYVGSSLKSKIEEILLEHKDKNSPRADNADQLEKGNLKTYLADYTFEVELYNAGCNKNTIVTVFNRMKDRKKPLNITNTADEFIYRVKDEKSEFAHALSIHLDDNKADFDTFTVPSYIENAIKWVINGE